MDIVKRLLAICAGGAAVLIILLIVAAPREPSPLVGQRAPVFETYDPEGVFCSCRDYSMGPAVFGFWLLSTSDGREALSILDRLQRDRELAGMAVVAINCDASSERMREFVKGKHFRCKILHMGDDPERLRRILELYHLHSGRFPRFFLIKFRERIVADLEGPHTFEELKQEIVDVEMLPWLTGKGLTP